MIHLAAHYDRELERGSLSRDSVYELYARYRKDREQGVLDAVAATAAVDALFLSDQVDVSQITPSLQEAFDLAYPNMDIDQLDRMDAEQIQGVIHAWKGKYFEVEIQDRLNQGDWVGELHLTPGQHAELAIDPTQPGWDVQILNADGTVDELLQLKATDSLSYIKEALERYPDIEVVATEEVASQMIETLINSGVSNAELGSEVVAPLADLLDGSLAELAEGVIPGLPLVIIMVSEGRYAIMGHQSFKETVDRSLERVVQSGTSIGVGALLAWMDAGLITLPVTFLTYFGISRFRIRRNIQKKINEDLRILREIGPVGV